MEQLGSRVVVIVSVVSMGIDVVAFTGVVQTGVGATDNNGSTTGTGAGIISGSVEYNRTKYFFIFQSKSPCWK